MPVSTVMRFSCAMNPSVISLALCAKRGDRHDSAVAGRDCARADANVVRRWFTQIPPN
jgi:hypothetical protein